MPWPFFSCSLSVPIYDGMTFSFKISVLERHQAELVSRCLILLRVSKGNLDALVSHLAAGTESFLSCLPTPSEVWRR